MRRESQRKILGLSGLVGAGKTCALQIFGEFGARIMSADHLATSLGNNRFERMDRQIVISAAINKISEFRKYGKGLMVFEVPIWLEWHIEDHFDLVLFLESEYEIRMQRIGERAKWHVDDSKELIYFPGRVPCISVPNNGTVTELKHILEIIKEDFLPKN